MSAEMNKPIEIHYIYIFYHCDYESLCETDEHYFLLYWAVIVTINQIERLYQ